MNQATKSNLIGVGIIVAAALVAYGVTQFHKISPSFAQKKADAEEEATKLLPLLLPDGWTMFEGVKCITWCRELSGSEFEAVAIDPDNHFVKVIISCDGGGSESKVPCSWRLMNPCVEVK